MSKIENEAGTSVPAFGPWLIAGTPVDEPYPCRCSERRFERCNAAFCPCAGRPDRLPEPCCSARFTPESVVEASREWRIKKMREKSGT